MYLLEVQGACSCRLEPSFNISPQTPSNANNAALSCANFPFVNSLLAQNIYRVRSTTIRTPRKWVVGDTHRSPFFPHTAADRELGGRRLVTLYQFVTGPVLIAIELAVSTKYRIYRREGTLFGSLTVHLEETSSRQEVSSFDSIPSMLSAVGRSLLPSRQAPVRSCFPKELAPSAAVIHRRVLRT